MNVNRYSLLFASIFVILVISINSYAESSLAGIYKWKNNNGEGKVEISHESNDSLDFTIVSEWGKRTCGEIAGKAVLTKNIAKFVGNDEYEGCLITLKFANSKLVVETSDACDDFCGETAKGSMAGIYKKITGVQ